MQRALAALAVSVFFVSHTAAHAAAPVWTVRDLDQFQDNFASDGTLTGFVRADMAADILPASSPGILPGDSSVVVVAEPDAGLATDGSVGGPAVYCYVAVDPNPYTGPKSGAALSGGTRWPLVGTQVIGGRTWARLRLDSCVDGGPVPDHFCIDLNDNYFTPGDTIYFFYGAVSADVAATTSYFSLEPGTTTDINIAAALPMEFTCLPAGGFNRGGAALYVDSAEDGVQAYWDSALRIVHLDNKVDRFDVRGAADGGNNRLSSRVVDVIGQLASVYQSMWWDCGSVAITLGDGSGSPQKTDEYALLNDFLNAKLFDGGVVLFGDNIAEQLASSLSPSATAFRSAFMAFTLVSGDHASAYGPIPTLIHWPGRCLTDDFALDGVGPPARAFDVLAPAGLSVAELTYGPDTGNNAAALSQFTVNANGGQVAVSLCGFSFADVRDDDLDGISDRALFLRNLLHGCAGVSPFPQVTPAGTAIRNILMPNHPNPFNPTTTISFSIAQRSRVHLAIYDVNGALVRTLANDTRPGGAYEINWDGRADNGTPVASGVYFDRLAAGKFTQTRKMVLLK